MLLNASSVCTSTSLLQTHMNCNKSIQYWIITFDIDIHGSLPRFSLLCEICLISTTVKWLVIVSVTHGICLIERFCYMYMYVCEHECVVMSLLFVMVWKSTLCIFTFMLLRIHINRWVHVYVVNMYMEENNHPHISCSHFMFIFSKQSLAS